MLSRFVSWRLVCYGKQVFSTRQSPDAFRDVTFATLGVKPRLTKALQDEEVLYPTEIQLRSLPKTLAGRNCIIQSQTGTGKSLTFLIPALQDSGIGLGTVVVTPSRELGAQLHYMADRIRPKEKHIVSLFSGVDNDLTVIKGNPLFCVPGVYSSMCMCIPTLNIWNSKILSVLLNYKKLQE